MRCYACGNREAQMILDQPAASIATNTPDDHNSSAGKFPCQLFQCLACGHVYEKVTPELRSALADIYTSCAAQLSVSMGEGNWGKERGEKILKHFNRLVDITAFQSALEIGCDKGYILRFLKSQGIQDVTGIEPSLKTAGIADGINFVKAFADRNLNLSRKFDFIYAFDVLDHVEDLEGFMDFIRRHLAPQGQVFISVNNADYYLETGSPALFMHQHIQYFTDASLKLFFERNGFVLKNLVKYQDEYHALAEFQGQSVNVASKRDYSNYENKLSLTLERISALLKIKHGAVHGASNTLKNILEWCDINFDFMLVDNDTSKQGQIYFGKKVLKSENVFSGNFEQIFIVPETFYPVIREDYLSRGFKGNIVGVR
ncbi:MAG: class I SAM-dependent methyltransferase [Candidatus Omnitrophica bacterium]|nr:class I SAM-dependent methyltransferase [Candidatus Omnitrophota bacterium]